MNSTTYTYESNVLICVAQFCKIGPLCSVSDGEILPDFTVIYGNNERRREKPGLEGLRMGTLEKQLEVERRLIPSQPAKFR